MDLHDLTDVLNASGPFVTVHVESESAVEQAASKHDLTWKDVVRRLEEQGVDEATRSAVYEARGEHAEGASRLVVATTSDATVRLAVPLGSTPARPVVDVSPLPHLLPLVDDVTTRIPHVVVLADHTGADVSAYDDTERVAKRGHGQGPCPGHPQGARGRLVAPDYQHRAENGWESNAREVVDTVVELAKQVGAQLSSRPARSASSSSSPSTCRRTRTRTSRVRAGAARTAARRWSAAGSPTPSSCTSRPVRWSCSRTTRRSEASKSARPTGSTTSWAALRKAQVETLLVTTDAPGYSTLLFGPEPTQLATPTRT